MTKFSTGEIPVFMTKIAARFYAWRARRRGFEARINYLGEAWFELGGRYSVELSRPNTR